MRWKIGLHFYWWRPAKWKKNNSRRVEQGEKDIWRRDSDVQTLKTLTSCEEALVSDASEMTLFRAWAKLCPFIIVSVTAAVVLTRSLCRNGTLEVNPKVSLVMIKEVRRIFHDRPVSPLQ